jgi:Purple acid Phosphatase, N-terminal domain
MSDLHIRKALSSSAIVALATLFFPATPASAGSQGQVPPPAPAAASVHITEGPEIESVRDGLAIIRWTSNNPGGSTEHYGVVHYGTDQDHLTQTAKSPIHLNQAHDTTVFRVRVGDLQPKTTYYYTVGSMWASGKVDPVKSSLYHFTTP